MTDPQRSTSSATADPISPVLDPVCSNEVTAVELVGRVDTTFEGLGEAGTGPSDDYTLVICGDQPWPKRGSLAPISRAVHCDWREVTADEIGWAGNLAFIIAEPVVTQDRHLPGRLLGLAAKPNVARVWLQPPDAFDPSPSILNENEEDMPTTSCSEDPFRGLLNANCPLRT